MADTLPTTIVDLFATALVDATPERREALLQMTAAMAAVLHDPPGVLDRISVAQEHAEAAERAAEPLPPGPIVCRRCGSSRIRFLEHVTSTRSVLGRDAAGAIVIGPDYCDGASDAGAERLECADCLRVLACSDPWTFDGTDAVAEPQPDPPISPDRGAIAVSGS